jgi:hypothetical protein
MANLDEVRWEGETAGSDWRARRAIALVSVVGYRAKRERSQP